MKKALIFALSLMMLVVFAVGCSVMNTTEPEVSQAPAAQDTVDDIAEENIDDNTSDNIDGVNDEVPAEEGMDETIEEVPADETTEG